MIGSLLSMRFYIKKPWMQSIMFWAVYLIIGIFVGSMIITQLPTAMMLIGGILISFVIFMALAMYWMGIDQKRSIIAFIIAYAIDYVIGMIGITTALITGGLI